MAEHIPDAELEGYLLPSASRSELSPKKPTNEGAVAVGIASLSIFFTGGICFGMSALYPVLYAEGVLVEQCGATLARKCSASFAHTKCCDAQMLAYTLLTSVALTPSDAFVAIYGEVVDRIGPRKVYLVGQLLAATGLALIALNVHLQSPPVWYAAFCCLGAAGPGIFFSILFLAERFPGLSPIITALSSATLDSSSMTFFLFNLLYFRGIGLDLIALGWLVASLLLCSITLAYLPSWRWLQHERDKLKATDGGSARSSLTRSRDGGSAHALFSSFEGVLESVEDMLDDEPSGQADAVGDARSASGNIAEARGGDRTGTLEELLLTQSTAPLLHAAALEYPRADPAAWSYKPPLAPNMLAAAATLPIGDLAAASRAATGIVAPDSPLSGGRRLARQMLRADHVLLLWMMSAANLKASLFIVAYSEDARNLFPAAVAERLDLVFNLGFPIGALVTSPLASLLLRTYRYRPVVYMGVALVGINFFSLCTLVPHPVAQALGALLFGPTRTLLWSSYFAFLAQPRRYSRSTAGRVLGYSNLIIAILSDAPPYLLNMIVTATPHGYLLVQLLLQACLLSCFAFPVHLRQRMRRKDDARDDATPPGS